MAISISDFKIAIRVDNTEAKAKFLETEEQIARVVEEMRKMEAEGKKDSAEYKERGVLLDKLNTSYAGQRKEVGRTALSYDELRKKARSLKAQMDKATPGSEKWKELRADFLLTKQRMKEVEVQAQETKFSLSRVADGFNRYAAIGASAIASLTGVALTARKCVDEYAEMEEAESQVRKYTGMTREEIKALNEEFKQMDTRTARLELNRLAGEAGKLGITGKKDVLEFVDAANMINVALGEDLGEDAVKNIGKLAQMFGEDDKLGLRGAMLATASAVNEVAQNSSAAEAYLVGFMGRVSGAANQAKIAQGDILGYASVLDQNMQQQEMAATAFQTLMMKMYQEPAKFAKMAGQNVAEFTSLIKNDANEAILLFLDSLNKKGGLDKLAPMFKEMGLDGVRASGVISAMAGKIDDIRDAQKLANDAYRDGTSAVNEYNVQNTTVQAELEKAKKRFADIRVELGERLLPVMKYMITTGSTTVKGMSAIISILIEYKTSILLATASIAGYTIAVNASIIADKVKVLWTGRIVSGLKTLYAVAKANPWAMLVTVGMALVGVLIDTNRQLIESERLERSLQDIRQRAIHTVDIEAASVRDFLKIARDENRSKAEREAAILRLNEISPEYLGNLTLEKINTEQATASVNSYVDSLLTLAEIKQTQQKISELNEKKEDIRKNGVENGFWENTEAKAAYVLNSMKTAIGLYTDQWADNVLDRYVNKGVKELRAIDKEIDSLNEHIEEGRRKLISIETKKGGGGTKCPVCGNDPCTCGGDTDKAFKEQEALLKKAMQTERNLWKDDLLNKKVTQEEYQQAMYDTEMMYLLKSKALLELYGKDSSAVQGQIYDKMIEEAERYYKDIQSKQNKEKNESLNLIDKEYQKKQQKANEDYLKGEIKTEKQFQGIMKQLEYDYLNERKAMLEKYGEDVSDINKKILNNQIRDQKDIKEAKRDDGLKDIDETDDYALKLKKLQEMYDADLISYAEYEEEKTRINEDNENERGERIKAVFDTIIQAAEAASQVVAALQDAEVSKITRKYDKEIKAAKKAGKDTTRLEEEKEEAINQVKKKYADKQFEAAVLQIVATTAMAAIQAYNAVVGIIPVGPVLAPIAAASAVAAGLAQLSTAKQARDEAKGLKEGGFSSDYVEGFTSSGNPNDVAGVIPVHKNEFVTNHDGVANPHVKQFLDVFDVAQKTGTIRMINTTQILEQVRTRSGKYAGGYSGENSSPASPNSLFPLGNLSSEQKSQVIILLHENNRLLGVLCEKELVVDSRKVRDGIRKVEMLEGNVSR